MIVLSDKELSDLVRAVYLAMKMLDATDNHADLMLCNRLEKLHVKLSNVDKDTE